MKALVYTAPEALAMEERPAPVPGPGEVAVRVEAVGICGSDMHAWLGHDARRPAPLILGHEAAGIVERGPRAGARVTINPLVTCGACAACGAGRDNLCPDRQILSMPPREGAFAQSVAVPERNLVAVPDHVSLTAAALTEPLACGWHAVRLARSVSVSDVRRALVIGGGAIGLGAALALAAQGMHDVTLVEPSAVRRAFLAETCGLAVLAPEDLPEGALFDFVVDGVGLAATRAMASGHARPGGVIVHVGLGAAEDGLDFRRMTLQEITFISTYTYTGEDFRQTAQAIFDGRLGPLDWTQSRPLPDGPAAFADLRAGRVAAPKIILTPWS